VEVQDRLRARSSSAGPAAPAAGARRGGDNRVGEVVVDGAHRPARTAARVGPAHGQRKVARRRRSGRTALVRRAVRRSTAPSLWECEIASGREAAAPSRPLRRPAHGGGGDSGAVWDLRPRRRQVVSESAPHTCRSEGVRRLGGLPRRGRIRDALPCPDGGPRQGAPPGSDGGQRRPGAGAAEDGAPPTIRAHSPGADGGLRLQEHGAEPVGVRDRFRA